jgi:hypothetical protein
LGLELAFFFLGTKPKDDADACDEKIHHRTFFSGNRFTKRSKSDSKR